jgi:hypothetical protein
MAFGNYLTTKACVCECKSVASLYAEPNGGGQPKQCDTSESQLSSEWACCASATGEANLRLLHSKPKYESDVWQRAHEQCTTIASAPTLVIKSKCCVQSINQVRRVGAQQLAGSL